MDTELMSPSNFNEKALMTSSSANFTSTVRGSTVGGRHRRPKTGVSSTGRNSTNL